MATNIVVPALGESVTEATVAKWTKAVGDAVQRDEPLLELETDKVTLEVYASTSGASGRDPRPRRRHRRGRRRAGRDRRGAMASPRRLLPQRPRRRPRLPARPPPRRPRRRHQPHRPCPRRQPHRPSQAAPAAPELQAPSVRKIVAESGIDITGAQGSGKDGRLIKADAAALAEIARETRKAAAAPTPAARRSRSTSGAPMSGRSGCI